MMVGESYKFIDFGRCLVVDKNWFVDFTVLGI